MKKYAGVYTISGKGTPRRYFCHAGGLLPQKCQLCQWILRNSGDDRTDGYDGIHLWKRNMMLSMVAGTAIYMLLVQVVFTG